MSRHDERFAVWLERLERRHLSELTFSEVSRALAALSAAYVERRPKLRAGGTLSGAGKRAAYALFYGPLHYLLVREIVRALPHTADQHELLVDLGCGTGAASAAWASAFPRGPRILAIDRHRWVIDEASCTYRDFELSARTRQGDLSRITLPPSPATLLAAFTLNELPDELRDPLLRRLIDRAMKRDRVLVVEPIARSVAPWWGKWSEIVRAAGGRVDEWRFRLDLPPLVAKLDRAAGLDHRELTGRSFWLNGPASTALRRGGQVRPGCE